MFSHVMLGANNVEESKRFYDAILGELDIKPGVMDELGRCFYMTDKGVFVLTKPINGEPACHGNGSTLGFAASSPELVEKWHEVGLENGGTACEDPPGLRSNGKLSLYLAYLRDPSGNKICALHRPK
ncbi:VOC family protein [Alteromonas flava]|uniref:VOC family protein n=1 Tax=Alteromonas flava TaxID=2048003 RepID=UPI000C290A35|nr:VOC family protein [Alteromonas flava]